MIVLLMSIFAFTFFGDCEYIHASVARVTEEWKEIFKRVVEKFHNKSLAKKERLYSALRSIGTLFRIPGAQENNFRATMLASSSVGRNYRFPRLSGLEPGKFTFK